MHITRRNFIWKSSLASIGLLLSNNLVLNSLSLTKDIKKTIAEKLKMAADLRRSLGPAGSKAGTKNIIAFSSILSAAPSLEEVKDIYQEIITTDGNEVRAYDGLRKTILHEKHKELEVYTLFLTTYNLHSANHNFKERLAQEYLRLATGNKKFAVQLNHATPLLSTSNQLFLELKNDQPENLQYLAQYNKTQRLITQDAEVLDARDNPALRLQRYQNRQNYQTRYNGINSHGVKERLDKLLAKNPHPDRLHYIRDVYKIYIRAIIKEEDYQTAIVELKNLFEVDPSDSNSLFLLREFCRKNGYLDALEAIERQNAQAKDTLWSKVALFDVLLKNSTNFTEMSQLLIAAENHKHTATELFEIRSRKIKLALAQSQLTTAKTQLLGLADQYRFISSIHWIDRFNMLCVAYFKKAGDNKNAIKVIEIALKEDVSSTTDALFEKIIRINKNRNNESGMYDERLNYQRNLLLT